MTAPPLNVIVMPQRDQLRVVFKRTRPHSSVRIVVLRAEGEHFFQRSTSKAFSKHRLNTSTDLAFNIAAPTRCSRAVIAVNPRLLFWRRVRNIVAATSG